MKRSVTIFSLRNGAGHPGAALNCLQRESEREREREREGERERERERESSSSKF